MLLHLFQITNTRNEGACTIVIEEEVDSLQRGITPKIKIMSPYLNAPPLDKVINKIVDCSETLFSKKLYLKETSQKSCNANGMTGFYIIQVFTEKFFRMDYS